MKETKIKGVYQEKDRLFTVNPPQCHGMKVYNERLVTVDDVEYRSWNPYRSKLAAALQKGLVLDLTPTTSVLYLGAATGTTVSHLSDIITHGIIYAVEYSPIAATKLLTVCEKRTNIIPILEDAFHPDRYSPYVSPVDLIYQDISQRNQAEIFITNIKRYLKPDGRALLMVKARSIDVALKPKQAYEQVINILKKDDLIVHQKIELAPFEKDHAALLVSRK
ncbi:MAG: fibrillarin-like rRNA/tRNA 2'-O-methyltransferase [Candidatus Thermoplasmatota archaeon]